MRHEVSAFFRLSVNAFNGLFVAVTFRVWRSRWIFQKQGRVTYEMKGRHFFPIELSLPGDSRIIFDGATRQRSLCDRDLISLALLRSLTLSYGRTNVTVHKSMVTRLNTAWIYRTRLSPCVMINYDDRMTAGRSPATRGWRRDVRVCKQGDV